MEFQTCCLLQQAKRTHAEISTADDPLPASQEWYEAHRGEYDEDDFDNVAPAFGENEPPLPDTIQPPTDATAPSAQPLQLVPVPRKPEDIVLNYAKINRSVDVVTLKQTLWRILCDDPPTVF